MEDKGTDESPVLSVLEARNVETGRTVPGNRRLFYGDRLVTDIWPFRKEGEPEERRGRKRVPLSCKGIYVRVCCGVDKRR